MPTNKILNSKRPNVSGLLTYTGIGSAALLAGLPVLFTLGPVFSSPNVSAEEAASFDGGSNVGARVGAAIAITAQNVSIAGTPTVGNTFITKTSTVNVKNTGSGGGYHLIMSSSNGSLENSGKTIDTFSGVYSKTGSEMKSANKSSWGYTLDPVDGTNTEQAEDKTGDLAATFYPIPVKDSTTWAETADQTEGAYKYAYLKNTTEYTDKENGDDVVVGYGFAIGPDTAAGDYTDTITYTAVANKDTRPETIFRLSTMQDMAAYTNACKNTPTPKVTATESLTDLGDNFGKTGINKIPTVTLTDTRDKSTYTIKKLADGNCWMTTSLKIAGKKLTSADSNVSADFTLQAAKTAVNQTANSTTVDYTFTGGGNGTYLYNFYAATAGKGGALGKDENSTDDICPKGWHLPNNTGNASWNKLLREDQNVYKIATSGNGYSNSTVTWGTYDGIKTATANPLGLQVTGRFSGGSLNDETTLGFYWTRTASSDTSAYSLGYNSGDVGPQSSNNKNNGFGVRCVSDGSEDITPANATYMQDVTSCPTTLTTGTQYELTDSRDNKKYTVSRLADGKCWMTKNLALGSDKEMTLNKDTSNVKQDGRTIPASSTSGFSNDGTKYVYIDSTYGGYYSYMAATAGTGPSPTSGTEDATEDICPKGWRLPTKAEYDTLKGEYTTGATLTAAPFKAQYGGFYRNSSPSNQGSNGSYWSSTAYSGTDAYSLVFGSSSASTGDGGKRAGRSVRCVFGS